MSIVPTPVNPHATRIYLAGKVAKDCWRQEHVPGIRWAYNDSGLSDHEPWPEIEMAHGLTYVGPYFTSCDHGCAHGPNRHGFAGGCITSGNSPEYSDSREPHVDPKACCHGNCALCDPGGYGLGHAGRQEVVRRCIEAIDRADWVIAVVGDDAHGTIAEIGYAVGKGKKVVLIPDGAADPVYNQPGVQREAWFPFYMPDTAMHYSVSVLLQQIAGTMHWVNGLELCESPIEKSLWMAMSKHHLALNGFQPQVVVGRYRLDFADAGRKLAIEADGFEFHTSKDQFTKDRQRQRDLELDGWRFIRFSGSEIHADADACAKQIVRWVESLA